MINKLSVSEIITLVSSGVVPLHLRWTGMLDPSEYVLLKNDWPYKIPKGSNHYCLWSKVCCAKVFLLLVRSLTALSTLLSILVRFITTPRSGRGSKTMDWVGSPVFQQFKAVISLQLVVSRYLVW
jgi:hypothetical protein